MARQELIPIQIVAQDSTKAAFNSASRNAQRLTTQLNHTANASRTMTRASRAQFGQLGHQVQDVAVQLQMGMNPLMVFAQQGSQVASIFGAKGAMAGGFIAVAAVLGQQLIPNLFAATKRASDMRQEFEDLEPVIKRIGGELALVDEGLAKAFEDPKTERGIVAIKDRINQLMNVMSGTGASITGELEEAFNLSFLTTMNPFGQITKAAEKFAIGGPQATREGLGAISNATRQISREFGVSEEAAEKFAIAAARAINQETPETIAALSDEADILATSATKNTSALISMAQSLNLVDQTAQEVQARLKDLGNANLSSLYTEDEMDALDALSDRAEEVAKERAKKEEAAAKAKAKAEADRRKASQDALVQAAKKEAEIFQQVQRMVESARSPYEKYVADLKEFRDLADQTNLSQAERAKVEEMLLKRYESSRQAITQVNSTVVEGKSALQEYAEAARDTQASLEGVAMNGVRSMEDGLVGLVNGTMSAKDAFRSMASSIINDMIRMQIQQQITGVLAGALSGFFSPSVNAVANANQISAEQAMGRANFNGGGFTGSGPRSGGVDGKGGFHAILHPNETVVDHTKGQSTGGVTVVQNINISTGVQQTVRNEIQTLLPQIANASKAAVLDARKRGGSFAGAF